MATPDDVARMSAEQQALYAARPAWAVAATAIAVWGGAAGCLGLILRKRWAVPLLVASLAGVIVQDMALFLLTRAAAQAGTVAMLLQGIVLLVASASCCSPAGPQLVDGSPSSMVLSTGRRWWLAMAAVVCFLACAASAEAQSSVPSMPASSHRFFDRTNIALTVVESGALIADGIYTQRGLRRYPDTSRELDPIARPFVSRGWPGQIAGGAWWWRRIWDSGICCIARNTISSNGSCR